MSMWRAAGTLAWEEPLALAARYADADMALLYSGLRETFTGEFSYLFLNPIEERAGSDWKDLPALPESADGLPLWVGHVGYGMRADKAQGGDSPVTLPDFRLVRYGQMLRFHHTTCVIEQFLAPGCESMLPSAAVMSADITISALFSNLTRDEYISIVGQTIEHIRAGNFYQANITRKFFGTFEQATDSFHLFQKLVAASPAPYSAYIRHCGTAILSSSPECFLSIDAQGRMTTRPIKGSARRSSDAVADAAIQTQLNTSAKNHAENLMIVDLMRNDLARVSTPRSVEVIEQSALYSYRTIHHLISTIRAQKEPSARAYDAVRACFPPGSMTGAPKIAAVRWCEAQEKLERGVYSGAIGWFGGSNSCDLSVVIRTLILEGDRFEFQVGGGIVADSTPEDEWRETLAKARGILAALGLTEEAIAAL